MDGLRSYIGRRIVCEGAAPSHLERRTGTIKREYTCDTRVQARRLVDELMSLSDVTYHPSRITVEGTTVVLETWTPNQGITQLDEDYCGEADEIYEECRRWW